MMHRKKRQANVALALAALLLCGCAGATGNGSSQETAAPEITPAAISTPSPDTEPAASAAPYSRNVTVSSVDEFLAAIAPDTQIFLEPGLYDLSAAGDYGNASNPAYYKWEDTYDGYQLVIHDVSNLAIVGSGVGEVTLAAIPRYANVLVFRDCVNPLVTTLTAGHTQEPGFCAGGVLLFERCQAPNISGCALYGCGTVGVSAENCQNLTLRDSEIYECSFGAVSAIGCYDVRVDSCGIHDCGWNDEDSPAFQLFQIVSCTGFAVINSEIVHNSSQFLLESHYSQDVYLLGSEIRDNQITDCAFFFDGVPATVADCSFSANQGRFYPGEYRGYARDREGNDLISFDLERMQRKEAVYSGPQTRPAAHPVGNLSADGGAEYHVSTVDEFLAAIGPDRTVYLDAECFDLSTASNYGGYGSLYYSWLTQYDGPCLIISGVSNFRLVGQGKDKTEILAVPRYADVLRFASCENIRLEAFTAGHTEVGECAGDVLAFENVSQLHITDCGLFGCGVWGIRAEYCREIEIENTEIYSCASGAFTMYQCDAVTMRDIDIHHMPDAITALLYDCTNFEYQGKLLGDGGHRL